MKLSFFNLLPFWLIPFYLQNTSQCTVAPNTFNAQETTQETIREIKLKDLDVQRENEAFQILNETKAKSAWEYHVIDSETEEIILKTTKINPTLSLKIGVYDVLVMAKGTNILRRHFRRFITVLPAVFTEDQADEVIDLSSVKSTILIKDFKNVVRPGYKIMIKGTYNGHLRFTGLMGTKTRPVHIINKGQVTINATSSPYPFAVLFSNANQYILFDGKADAKIPYGFKITGNPEKSGQVFMISGLFNKGVEICGVTIKGQQGKTEGAAGIQVQTAFNEECNADNWNFEYMKIHHIKIEESSSEGLYLGYFTDSKRDTGFSPHRLGQVLIYRDSIINSGWDGIQIALADEFEVHDNYVDGVSLSGHRDQSSMIIFNSGNDKGWCYRNTFKNGAHGATVFYGETGREAYIYSNLFVEGTFPESVNTVTFFYSKLNNTFKDPLLYIFNNTIVTTKLPVKVQYQNDKPGTGIPMIFAGNAIMLNSVDKKIFPEIAMGDNVSDSASWKIDNMWRPKDKRSELKLTDNFYPEEKSPVLKSTFSITHYLKEIKGGFYDRDGYPLEHEKHGSIYGCYSGPVQ